MGRVPFGGGQGPVGGYRMGLNQNHQVQEYINSVCSQIKNRRVHKEIKKELLGHIEEIALEYVSQGATQEEAAAKAIARMGDAKLVGRQLDRIHKLQPEWGILIITVLFANLGLFTMYLIETKGVLLSNLQVFHRSLVFTLLGAAAALGLYFFDYRKIRAYSTYIYAGTLLVLLFVIHSGTQFNGLKAWLTIGPLNINFVEISPFLFITALAGLFDGWDWNKPKNVLYGWALSMAPAVIMLAAPSFSACIVYSIAFVILMVVSGIKFRHVLLAAGAGLGVLLLAVINRPWRISRLLTFINPGRDPQGGGWINIQLNKITHSAGLFGQGYTFDPKTMPDIHTDFVFAYIVHTFGWIAGIILAALVIAFLIRMARTAIKVKDTYGKLLVSGFAAIFAVQFLWNMLMNLSLAPISGFGLPFISYGGSQSIVSMLAIGLIMNIHKWKNNPEIVE